MATYELIAKSVLGSNAAYIEFTSIPADYDDLVVLASIRSTRTGNASDQIRLSFNGVTTNLSYRFLYGTGSAAGSASDTNGFVGIATASSATANSFSSLELVVPNYAGSTNKSYSSTCVQEYNTASGPRIDALAGLWSNTNAITSIRLTTYNANTAAGSSAYLYGITKA